MLESCNSWKCQEVLNELVLKDPKLISTTCTYLCNLQHPQLLVDLVLFYHLRFKEFQKTQSLELKDFCICICMELKRLNWISWMELNAKEMPLQVSFYSLILLMDVLKFQTYHDSDPLVVDIPHCVRFACKGMGLTF